MPSKIENAPNSSRQVAGDPAPGESSAQGKWHVKGNVYLGTRLFFETKVHGGLEALYGAIDDPGLLAFIQQRFLPVAWYDVLPAVPLIRCEAKAMGLTMPRYLLLRSRYQAEKDLSGVYRFFLKLTPAEMLALKLPRLFTQIFDFGSSEAHAKSPNHVEAKVLDFPAALADWFAISLEVYADTALRLTGARDVAVSVRKIDAGVKAGMGYASLHLDFRWGARDAR